MLRPLPIVMPIDRAPNDLHDSNVVLLIGFILAWYFGYLSGKDSQ